MLKRFSTSTETSNQIIQVLYRYAFVQIIAIGPSLLSIPINTFFDFSSDDDPADTSLYQIVVNSLLGLTGFGNSLVFFYQRKRTGVDDIPMPTPPASNYYETEIEASQVNNNNNNNKSFDSFYALTAALM